MKAFRTPNFRGRRALVLHREGDAAGGLARQLERLGLEVAIAWPDFPVGGERSDVVLFDADNGFDGLFPWVAGEPPMPLIALLGSELPGRLEWALSQGLSAHVVKPIQSSGVFSALVIAFSNFETAQHIRGRIAELTGRLAARPAVVRAVVALMRGAGLAENAAFARIRSAAMARRMTVEAFCAGLDAAALADLARSEPAPPRRRRFGE